MNTENPLFARRTAVSRYASKRLEQQTESNQSWKEQLRDLDLHSTFTVDDRRIPLPSKEEIDKILQRMGKFNPEDELDCGACGYETCREHAIAILKGLAESEMCLPYTIDRLKNSLEELNLSNERLADTQEALLNAEKLASMGQLSAGIAHEINNPLGVILLYSKLMIDEGNADPRQKEDLQMIVEQAERCKTIVSGLLNFARKNEVNLKPCNICDLVDHCLKIISKPDNIHIEISHELDSREAIIDPDQITQVLTNLINNAVEAMPDGGKISITTRGDTDNISVSVEDNGTGIPQDIIKKIFEPLFTTKQIGKGTGLGLAVTYGIVKVHHGQIDVKSNADEKKGPTGTIFTVTLPRKNKIGVQEGFPNGAGSGMLIQ
jgi:signal transduction histidine kinase